ncbi:MAG TPA: acetyl-CoA C-acetyltransferase [Oligoflexus sp.]|uniref:acetyl-CoA C-acetyltransferase n=1 Tax=Oligoflexus sp. TaxID=1971216 RepID=UPI002D49013C|nr:acetyl-CoA C-acetyltransferase [Oligoflexus sp.]HYX32733.1 acetyl-CoA C-acetyltransferase [Oligoflexus sp.]
MTGHAYIYDAVRTPRGKGKADGTLYEVKPISLLSQQLKALQKRNNLDTSLVSDVVMGCVTAVGEQGMNIAKSAAMLADWNEVVAGVTLNRFCASGLEAINLAAAKVASGYEDLVVAGGVESMSRVPMGMDGGAWAQDPETNLHAGFMPQGLGADLIATLEGFSRDAVDEFALQSHIKAARAEKEGYFKKSQVPVVDQNGLLILDRNEMIRAETNLAALNQLKASFTKMGEMGFNTVAYQKYPAVERLNHVHTAGNSSGISDGAAAVLVGSQQIGDKLGLAPRARILATAAVGSEPTIMLTGPAPATRLALKKANLDFSDIDLFEVNEAFASVVLKFQKETGVPMEKINVNGGAIAMGHPLGATGAILTGTLLDELDRRQLRYGVVTLCIGAGMGIATVFERIG